MIDSILITGSGCPGWYSVFLSLKKYTDKNKIKILGCDSLQNTAGSILVDKHFKVPRGGETPYISKMKRIVKENKIQIIIPLTDPELIPLALSMKDFEKMGCKILISEAESLKRILKKDKLYKGLKDISPKFIYYSSFKDTLNFIKESSYGNTCFLKPLCSHGSRGVKRLVSKVEWVKKCSRDKPEEFGLAFPVDQIEQLSTGDPLMISEFLPGEEYSVDCLFNSQGELVFYGVRERERTRSGICHTAKFIIDKEKEFLSFIYKINTFVKMRYNINIQVKRDKEGELKLLEINPRISGSIGSFQSVGYNLVLAGIKELLGQGYSLCEGLSPFKYNFTRAFRVSFFEER